MGDVDRAAMERLMLERGWEGVVVRDPTITDDIPRIAATFAAEGCEGHVLAYARHDADLIYHVDNEGRVVVPGVDLEASAFKMRAYDRYVYTCVRCGAVYTRDVVSVERDTERPRFGELVARV